MFKSSKPIEAKPCSKIHDNDQITRNQRINNRDLVMLYLHKVFASAPAFETEEEIKDWLRKENAKPTEQTDVECRNLLEEARKELEQCSYLY